MPLVPAVSSNAPHAGSLTQADRVDGWLHILHRVVDGQTGRDAATRRVDIEIDVFFRIFRFEKQQLSDDEVGEDIVDRSAQENDAVFQESRIDIVGPFAPIGLLNDNGH